MCEYSKGSLYVVRGSLLVSRGYRSAAVACRLFHEKFVERSNAYGRAFVGLIQNHPDLKR